MSRPDSARATIVRAPFGAGLYLITDAGLCAPRGLEATVGAALGAGATVVQYRDKGSDRARRVEEAGALREICASASVPLIVNDDVDLAREIGADGLVPGDVIHAINGQSIVGLRDLRDALSSLDLGDAVVLHVEREGIWRYVAFELQ